MDQVNAVERCLRERKERESRRYQEWTSQSYQARFK
jgi:hypothetical protein